MVLFLRRLETGIDNLVDFVYSLRSRIDRGLLCLNARESVPGPIQPLLSEIQVVLAGGQMFWRSIVTSGPKLHSRAVGLQVSHVPSFQCGQMLLQFVLQDSANLVEGFTSEALEAFLKTDSIL